MKGLSERYELIMETIERLKTVPHVQMVVVTKAQSLEAVLEVYRLGHRDFGENYLQCILEKKIALEALGIRDIVWHWIGVVQSNKIQKSFSLVHYYHGVVGIHHAIALKTQHFFLQFKLDAKNTKLGFALSDWKNVKYSMLDNHVCAFGLMGVPSLEEPVHLQFEALAKVRDQLGVVTAGALSMGMSQDYALALQYGATHVRIGTGLFGDRSISFSKR